MRLTPRALPSAANRPRVPSVLLAALTLGTVALMGCGSGGSDASSASSQSAAKSATALISAGIAQANAKHFQQAETTFRNVLVISPKNKFAWYNLGLLAQLQKQSGAAVTDYSTALSIDPRYTPAMYNKAILLERTDPHGALALYRQITSINPKAATAYLRESFVYEKLGDKVSAKQARGHAVALDSRLAAVPSPAP